MCYESMQKNKYCFQKKKVLVSWYSWAIQIRTCFLIGQCGFEVIKSDGRFPFFVVEGYHHFASYRKIVLIKVSISILQWDFCRTSSLRKRWSQKVINSALTLGFASFSQAILVSSFSFVAPSFFRRPFVDLVKIPCGWRSAGFEWPCPRFYAFQSRSSRQRKESYYRSADTLPATA